MTQHVTTDVLILGGGPAGAVAAKLLVSAGLRVTVLTRPSPARRLGDTLSPEAAPVLDQIKGWELLARVPAVPVSGTVTLWGTPQPMWKEAIWNPFGGGWHVDRPTFDRIFLEAANTHGAMIERDMKLRSLEKSPNGWLIHYATLTTSFTLQTNWLIDATGRNAWLAHRLHRKITRVDDSTAVVGILSPHDSLGGWLAVEAVVNGWWYIAPHPSGVAVVGYVTDAALIARNGTKRTKWWYELLKETSLIRTMVTSKLKPTKLHTTAAGMTWSASQDPTEHYIAIGDAWHALDPLSGLGLTNALESAVRAVNLILAIRSDNQKATSEWKSWTTSRVAENLRARRDYYQLHENWPNSLFWKKRAVHE